MKIFTVKDYKDALRGVGPKTAMNILGRAAQDDNINFSELKQLWDYYEGRMK